MTSKVSSIALALVLIIGIVIQIGNVTGQVPNPDHIYYATDVFIETCDPHWAYDEASRELIQNVYEPLCGFSGTAVGEFVALIADSWPGYGTTSSNCIIPSPPGPIGIKPINQTWYFHIRTGNQWQDPAYGVVTPADVEYSFERGMLQDHSGGPMWMLLDPLTNHTSTWEYDYDGDGVLNATEAHDCYVDITSSVESNSTYVWFNLVKPYPSFQQILSQTWSMIMDEEWCIAHGLWNGTEADWLNHHDPPAPGPLMVPVPQMMGTGPYTLDAIDMDPHTGWYRLRKFDDYWRGWPAQGAGGFATYATVKVVGEWPLRKYLLLSGSADYVSVPANSWGELHPGGDIHAPPLPGIRMTRIPRLELDALCFAYNMSSDSPYVPYIGSNPEPTLFRDRNMRLAFAHCLNFTQYIEEMLFDGEQVAGYLPNGTLYYNSSKPKLDYDLTEAAQHFQVAWGGEVWTQGITVYVPYNLAMKKEMVAGMLEYTIENLIPWPDPNLVDVIPIGLPWSDYLLHLHRHDFCCFISGWISSDFPDPHPWAKAFMDPVQGLPRYQEIEYGLDPITMNWENTTYGPPPYTNALGEDVTEINNTYVAHLIEVGFTIRTCDPIRRLIYEELMDIYHAEVSQLPLAQSVKRHYERTWLHGWVGTWNENTVCPGDYFYTMWKGLDVEPIYVDVSVVNINLLPWLEMSPSTNNITDYLINQPYHAPRPGVPWMKLNTGSGATNPIFNVWVYVKYFNASGPDLVVYIVCLGKTSKGYIEKFGEYYVFMHPTDTLIVGPCGVSQSCPPVGSYELWVECHVLGDLVFNVNATKDFDSGYFYRLGYCDLNKDNVVDGKDYVIVKKVIPSLPGDPRWNWIADVNNSNSCTVADYQLVKSMIPTVYPDP